MKEVIEGVQEQLVVFNLKKQIFGINIAKVQEIIKEIPITYVPKTPKYIRGVINLRGKIIPVLDLYQRLKLEAVEEVSDWRIIILEEEHVVVGVLVDGVSEVLSLSSENIEQGSQLAKGLDSKYMHGIGKHGEDLIIILDLKQVLGDQDTFSEKVG